MEKRQETDQIIKEMKETEAKLKKNGELEEEGHMV